MKLRPKFRLAFLLVGMVPLLITVCFGYWRASKLLRAKAVDHLQSVASLKAQQIESVIDRDLEILKLVSSRTQMRINLAKYLQDPRESYQNDIGKILTDAKNSIADLKTISITDLKGAIVASTDVALIGADRSGEAYFLKSVGSGGAGLSLSAGDGGLETRLCGLLELQGEQIGVVVIESNARAITAVLLSGEGMGATGETLLGSIGDGGEVEVLTTPRLGEGKDLQGGAVAGCLAAALDGQDGLYIDLTDYRGKEIFAASRYLEGRGLGLVVKIDKGEALAPMQELKVVSAMVAAALLVTVLIASVAISRSVTRPLSSLASATRKVREGDLSIRAAVESEGEVADLAKDFNSMADHLEEAQRNLERKVQARTEELALSRERFELAVAGTADGIWDWDIGEGEVFFSDRFKELLGLAPQEMENRYDAWEVMLHPADKRKTLEAIRAHLEEDFPYDVEYRLACTDGSYRWFRARGKAVRDAGGKPVRMAGSISDIEDYRRVVNALVQSNRDLEQFAYVASHDLKEPLRMVASYVQLLDRRYSEQLDDTAREFIGYATEGAKRMRQLVDDLLVYARIGTRGKNPEPTESERSLRAAIADLKLAIIDSGAKISHAEMPIVMGDPTQLTQLFQNLLGNAIKFRAPNRAPEIEVTASESDGEWTFKVSDNGIGIGEEYQGKIFEIFQRVHSREKFPGTGIGLAVCAKIVGRHDGRIWVESEPEGGASFFFTMKAVADLGAAI